MDWDEAYDLEQARKASRGRSSSRLPGHANMLDSDDDLDETRPMTPIAGPASNRRRAPLVVEDIQETPLEQLTRHWLNERLSPDILPAQEDLLSNLLDHLRRQSNNVQTLREDPSTSEDEHIRITLVQTEIERVKFIIRSYIRSRLYKIERYARFITTDADAQTRLTAAERDHASRHAKITDQHLYLSVLQSLPEAQAHLDDTPVFYPSMVTEPDKTRPVFVHALRDCPGISLPDGTTLKMNKGHISLSPYTVMEELVASGAVELV